MIVKYEKIGGAAYQSHLDILHQMNRILCRAKITVERSQGFNPHSLLYFSSPIPVGCESECEYFTLSVENFMPDFCDKFNDVAPQGIRALKVGSKEVDIANIVMAATFRIGLKDTGNNFKKIVGILDKDEIIIEKVVKKQSKPRNIRPFILDISTEKGNLFFKVKQGKENLRTDDFLKMLVDNKIVSNDDLIYPVRKVKSFALIDDKYVDVDKCVF